MKKPASVSATTTLGTRLKSLRKEVGLSQEAMGTQGLMSTAHWIKMENGERSASDALLVRLGGWLLRNKHKEVSAAGRIIEELLTLKHLGNRSAFVRKLARRYAEELFVGTAIKVSEKPGAYRMKSHRAAPRTPEH